MILNLLVPVELEHEKFAIAVMKAESDAKLQVTKWPARSTEMHGLFHITTIFERLFDF